MKGIIGALLISAIVYTHGAPLDKSEWSSVIKDLQREYNSRNEESHSRHALNSDYLQSVLKNLKHRHENNNDKGDNEKLSIPSNLQRLKNKSDSSDSDSDDDKSKLSLSRGGDDEKNNFAEKNSGRQKSTGETFNKVNSRDSSESNSRTENSDEENSKHDLSESGGTREDTDSSDSSSFDKSENVQHKRDKHHSRDRKGKHDSRQHENYKNYNVWSDSNSDSESGEDEFKQYLRNVSQNKKNRKEIIQMLRNRNIEGQHNLSRTDVHYNKLYTLNRDKFLEWKKKMNVKDQLLSEKETLSTEELRDLCNISEETEDDVEEDRIKQCVKNHVSMNDTFNITTDLSDILPPTNKNTTVQIHRDNDTNVTKVSIDVNKRLSNGDTLQIHVENEKPGDPNASTIVRKVIKAITKEGRINEISSSDNNQPLNNSISNVVSNSTPGQGETLETSEAKTTNSGGEQTSSNDDNSSSSVPNRIEEGNSPVNGGDVSENGQEQTKPNIDSVQETQSSSKQSNTIPDTESEQTPVLMVNDSEKSTSSADGSESSSISESVTSEIQQTDVPNFETESSDAIEEQTTELSTPVPQSEHSAATEEEEEDSGLTDANSETTTADLNIGDSPALNHGKEKLPANRPENSNTEEASESTESSNVTLVTGEQQVVELTSPQSEIALSDDGNEQTESNGDRSAKPEDEQTASASQTEESKVPGVEHVSDVPESETDSTLERDIEENDTSNNNEKSTDNVDEQTDSSIGESLISVDVQTTSSSFRTESTDPTETELTESSNFDEKVNKSTLQTNESSITVEKTDLPSSPASDSNGTASTADTERSEVRTNSSSPNENITTVVLDEKLESDAPYNTVVSEAASSITTIEYPSSESPVELSNVTV